MGYSREAIREGSVQMRYMNENGNITRGAEETAENHMRLEKLSGVWWRTLRCGGFWLEDGKCQNQGLPASEKTRTQQT
jgi:hypothetical protein